MSSRIAIVEDDPDILKLVALTMEKAGFQVYRFTNGYDFLMSRIKNPPDLLILDLMLPDMDGLEICRRLRSASETRHLPIIMLTACSEEVDRILGLEMGADDYVTKPFSSRELLARAKAVLRRGSPEMEEPVLELGGILRIHPQRYEAKVHDQPVDLTGTEFKLLKIMAEKPGRVFSREQLLDQLWGGEKFVVDRTIDVHVKNLRDKLGPAGAFIKSIRGIGYKVEL